MSDRKSWDAWFLNLARMVASRSRDPSTKVGAVIVRPDKTITSVGFNGFARGVVDTNERLLDRDFKIAATIHAEQNAVLNAHEAVRGYDLYVTPFHPCSSCAAVIAQSGIRRVVIDQQGDVPDRWKASFAIAATVLSEGGVHVETIATPARYRMTRTIVESPYSGDVEANVTYARAAVADSIRRGETPIASHIALTQPGILDDEDPSQRTLGISCGLAWLEVADLVAVYEDRGISPGMKQAIAYAKGIGIPVVHRSLTEVRDVA